MKILGVLWHFTGANNPTLKRYVKPSEVDANRDALLKLLGKNGNKDDWNHITMQAGLNAWIGKLADGTVATVQTMPWNYRPWGFGAGAKGSCNDGWIQFEICEDNLKDAAYFDAVYKEACELTAYLCQLYGIDPNGTVTVNGVKVPTILCHADSAKLGLGSNHGDIDHWFPKYGKSMTTTRADVAKLLGSTSQGSTGSTVSAPVSTPVEKPATSTLYRVRKTWTDAKSREGRVQDPRQRQEIRGQESGYSVFDENGTVVYPEPTVEQPTDAPVTLQELVSTVKVPFLIRVTTGVAIYTDPGTVKTGKGLGKGTYTIVEVRGDYGRLKSGFGWVQMGDVIRI